MFICPNPEEEKTTSSFSLNPNELVCLDAFEENIREKISPINLTNFYQDLLFYSRSNAINISFVKRLLLKHLSKISLDNATVIMDWLKSPFYSIPNDKRTTDLSGKHPEDAYLSTNLTMIFAKELNCFDFEMVTDSLENCIKRSSQLDMIHVMFFIVLFSNVDPVERCEMLFRIFDYGRTGKLVIGKKVFYKLFRKLLLICLFTSDILLNDFLTVFDKKKVIKYDKRLFSNNNDLCTDGKIVKPSEESSDPEYFYFKTYTDIVFEYKKFLFFLRYSHNVMKECVTYISHSLIFFQNRTKPEISKSEFLTIMKENNYDILNPRAYRILFVQFLLHNIQKSRVFITEFSYLIRALEKKIEDKSTENIRCSKEESIKELNLKKDYDKYIAILEKNIQCCEKIMLGDKYRMQKEKEEMTKHTFKSTGKKRDSKMSNTLSFKFTMLNPEKCPLHVYTMQPKSSIELDKICNNLTLGLNTGQVPTNEKFMQDSEKNQSFTLRNRPHAEEIFEEDGPEQQEQDTGDFLKMKNNAKGGFCSTYKKTREEGNEGMINDDKMKEKDFFNNFNQFHTETIVVKKDSTVPLDGNAQRTTKDSQMPEKTLTILKTISRQVSKNESPKFLTALENENIEENLKHSKKQIVEEKPHGEEKKKVCISSVKSKPVNNALSPAKVFSTEVENDLEMHPNQKKPTDQKIVQAENPKCIEEVSEINIEQSLVSEGQFAEVMTLDKGRITEKTGYNPNTSYSSLLGEGKESNLKTEKVRATNPILKFSDEVIVENQEESPQDKGRITSNPLLKFSQELIPEDHGSNVACGQKFVQRMSKQANNDSITIDEEELLWNYFSTIDSLKLDMNVSQMKSKIVMVDTNRIKITDISGKRHLTKEFDPQQLMNILEFKYDVIMIDLYLWLMDHYNKYLRQTKQVKTKVKLVDIYFFNRIEKCFGNSDNYDSIINAYKDYLYEDNTSASLIFHNPMLILAVPIYIEIPNKKDKKLIITKFIFTERKIIFYDISDSIVEIDSIPNNIKLIFEAFFQYLCDQNLGDEGFTNWTNVIDVSQCCVCEELFIPIMLRIAEMICRDEKLEMIPDSEFENIRDGIFIQVAHFYVTLNQMISLK